MPHKMRIFARLCIAVLAVLMVISVLEAQYFGRNKVQYQKFDFRIIKTKHFDVYYYPEFKSVAEDSARLAERWYARLSRMLGHELVHAFQYDITSVGGPGGGAGGGMNPGLARVPLWFIEGLAEYLSIGSVDPHTARGMRGRRRRHLLPTPK